MEKIAVLIPLADLHNDLMHFNTSDWWPNVKEVVRGGTTMVAILVVGVICRRLLHRVIERTRLNAAYVVAVIAMAIYFGIGVAKPHQVVDVNDYLAVWLTRVFAGALLFSGIRVLDRLVIVPILSHGGRVPVQRFVHQIVSILITIFTILVFGSFAFDWDINKFLAGSAVVSIVLGLALQETLGNFFSGLVMQASSPFAIGDWIVVANVEGRVVDMTWRAVTIHTTEDNYVIVPNGTVSKEQIVNYYTPTKATARSVHVGLEYSLPPGDAIAVLKAATMETAGVTHNPEAFVYLDSFDDSSVNYRVKFWITEPGAHQKIEHLVRSNIWYRLKQKGYGIPSPIRMVEHVRSRDKQKQEAESATEHRLKAVSNLWLFAPLSAEQKRELADGARDLFLFAGQTLFHQADSGDSCFIIRKGEVDVLIRHEDGRETKVATLKSGEFFGEMSALTGQPRTATIRAVSELACVEIDKTDLDGVFAADSSIMEKISGVVAERNARREAVAAGAVASATTAETVIEQQKTLLGRMLRFFNKGSAANIAALPASGAKVGSKEGV